MLKTIRDDFLPLFFRGLLPHSNIYLRFRIIFPKFSVAIIRLTRNSLQLILTTSHTFHFISSCCIWNRLRAFDFEVFIDIVHVLYWF